MNFYLYQIRLQFILSFEILSVRDVRTEPQTQTHLRHLVIAHAANKLLENCAINCKKTFINKINLRLGIPLPVPVNEKLIPNRSGSKKKSKFRLQPAPGSGPWTTLISFQITLFILSRDHSFQSYFVTTLILFVKRFFV